MYRRKRLINFKDSIRISGKMWVCAAVVKRRRVGACGSRASCDGLVSRVNDDRHEWTDVQERSEEVTK